MASSGEPGSGRGNLVRVNIVLAVIDALLIAAVVGLFVLPDDRRAALFGADGDAVAEEQPAEEQTPAAEAEEEAARESQEEPPAEPTQDEPAQEEPAEPAPAEEPPVSPARREVTTRHTVASGDTFYDIAGRYWENEHLWPDLYVLNAEDFANPDLMRPGEVVDIYPSLAADGELSRADVEVISEAYIRTYSTYRRLGAEALERGRAEQSRYYIELARNRINKAHWLLYSGHRFNRNLAAEHAERIDERDLAVVRRYLARFGYPPDP